MNKGAKKMSLANVVLIIIYVVLSVGGLVIFKLGSNKMFNFSVDSGNLRIGINFLVILGLLLYIGSFLVYTFVVSQFDLSYIYPICTGFIYILVFVSSALVLKETISIYQYLGSALILVGIILINIKR